MSHTNTMERTGSSVETTPLRRGRPGSALAMREVGRYVILTVAAAVALYPVVWLLSVAMKTQSEYVQDPNGLPDGLDFSNFATVLGNDSVIRYLVNSVIVVSIAVPIVVLTASMAGYALARLWGERTSLGILMFFLLSEFVPIGILAVPLLLTVQELGIDDGKVRLVCVYSVMMMGFAVLIFRAFFRSIPEELREAARLDGCGEFKVFWRIMVPLARSPIAMVCAILFIVMWNELFLAVVLLRDASDRTLPLGLTELRGTYQTNWPTLAAALLLSAIPTLVIYAIFQKRITGQFSRSTSRE